MAIRLWKDERGVSAVVMAVSLIGIIGALVLSLDAGNLWTSKRAMVTATDSSALLGAQIVGQFPTAPVSSSCPSSVQTSVTTQLQANQPTASLVSCTITSTQAHLGFVTVSGRKPVQVGFARVVGVGNQSAFSSSSARFFPPQTVSGLRPISFCKDNPLIVNFLIALNANDFTGTHTFTGSNGVTTFSTFYNNLPVVDPLDYEFYNAGDGQVHVVTKFQLSKLFGNNNSASGPCTGSSSGNWGFVDFDNGQNGTPDLRTWFLNGYQRHQVGVGDCDPTTPGNQDCALNPGLGGNSLDSTLQQILNATFAVPLFDTLGQGVCGGNGGGNNGCFNVWGFLGVTLRDYKLTGNNAFIGFELSTIQVDGTCCGDPTHFTGTIATYICSVDHDPISADSTSRCTKPSS